MRVAYETTGEPDLCYRCDYCHDDNFCRLFNKPLRGKWEERLDECKSNAVEMRINGQSYYGTVVDAQETNP